ncbi:MAG TPA: DeoR/GlpR family DNA-binding transcription regulator [Clostridia bacterium]|nr:DeoR/GlpR transcriptional regulator [Clostridiaceae bacterium]HOF26863.1 DeoR/GlpR family DNA-binding transcription regulator [Clostridia bacterium]HOM34955.1 DeoR/GlpR family DNA-binding transcription regulator [Clostridia bacterium]HOR90126.1 DeoR/GlpR family DNA-binding transcription regulator [Clostridia bacterium]HOT70388.1 DeoR/GlpR family DNA-binding transcription regulator [Clostridia bacterium]
MNQRQLQIKRMLDDHSEVFLKQLKKIFSDVSEMTIRRDLILLEDKGYAVRTHGGAVSINRFKKAGEDETGYTVRQAENVEKKAIIARKASHFIEKDRSVYLDAGSTVMGLANLLTDMKGCTFITSAVNTALKLASTDNSVILLGGTISPNTLACSGPEAMQMLEIMNIDLAVMGASGFSAEKGFSVSNMHDAKLKTRIIEKARKTIMLADSTKIDKDKAYTFCRLKDVDIWVCDTMPDDKVLDKCKKDNVLVV